MARPDVRRGVFETLLVRAGRPLELDAHLSRLRASLDAVYGTRPPAGTRDAMLERARGVALGRLRVTVAPGAGPELRLAEVAPELVFPGWHGALTLRPLEVRGGLGAHKWADRSRVLGAEADPDTLPLVVDADGSVLEASRGNVFLVRHGVLVTPRTDGRLLSGVTRRRVLALARAAGLPVREERVTFGELLAADEMFVTGAVRGIEPVSGSLDAVFWPDAPVAARLAELLRRQWADMPVKEESRCP
jgi:para-aminobenzoate synthetase/4-amino-4-deoxychorismate lyase